MLNQIRQFNERAGQEGLSTLEYIVLAAVLAIGLVAAIGMFRGQITNALQAEGNTLETIAGGDTAAGNVYSGSN